MATKMLQVQDYTGYIKCGEILKSPLPYNQYPFILKCVQCDEINFILESFVIHIREHYKDVAEEKGNCDIKNADDYPSQDECIEKSLIKVETIIMEVDDPLVVIKNEKIEEYTHDDADADYNTIEDNEDFEDNSCDSDEDFNTDDAETDDDDINYDLSNKKRKKSFKNTLPSNIENFIKCKENMCTLIELYKNQPNLWKKDLPFYGLKDKRQSFLEETTKELNDKLNLEIKWKEVSDIISYIYRKQRIDFRKLRRYEEENQNAKAKTYKTCWFFDDVDFLRPKPVVQLKKLNSNLPDLTKEQVIKIIEIYREFPHLWNSNLIEFICANKRHAAHNEMLKSLETKLDIKISVASLEEYLRTLHYYFSREKSRKRTRKRTAKDYYENLLYLYDHEGPFDCCECNRVLRKPLLFKIHKASHDDSVPFICSQCNKEFTTTKSYTVHAKRHFEDLEYACNMCDKKFIAYNALKLHLITHTSDRPYFCEICGASYRQTQGLSRHKRRHEKRYSHVCQICSKGFYSKQTYDGHMNSHMNIRSHVCELCGKGFFTRKALKTHAVTHEDVRNHACELCGKTFKLKIGVLQHMRTHGKKFEIDDEN